MTNISYSYMCGVLGETHISQELPVLYFENRNAKFYKLFEIDWREFLIIQGIFQRKSTKKGGNDFNGRTVFSLSCSHLIFLLSLTPLRFSVHGSSRKKLLFDLDKLVWYYREKENPRIGGCIGKKKIKRTYYNKLKKLTWLGWSFNVTPRFETFFHGYFKEAEF